MQILIPELVSHKPLNVTPNIIGSTYEHTIGQDAAEYKYETTILEYQDGDSERRFKLTLTCSHTPLSQAGEDILNSPEAAHTHNVKSILIDKKAYLEA